MGWPFQMKMPCIRTRMHVKGYKMGINPAVKLILLFARLAREI